jgi:hypothetical protein
VTERLMKLRGAIFKLALGILLLLPFTLAGPVAAESSVLTGSFTVQLTISKVAVSGIGISYATISWETNGNATSVVFYDTRMHEMTDGYKYQEGDSSTLAITHRIYLTGLSPSTTYHYRIKSVARVDSIELIATSQDYDFTTGKTGGGGGSGGVTIKTLTLGGSAGIIDSPIRIDSQGIALNGGQISTTDEILTLKVKAGTQLLDNAGQPLSLMRATIPASSPSPPALSIIVLVYDLGPSGATFTPPITLMMNYQSRSLPQGVPESTLYVAYWDGSAWQAMQSTVDTRAKNVSAWLSHLTLFALIGKPELTATPTPTPIPTAPLTPTPTLMPTPTLTPVPMPTPAPTLPSLTSTPVPLPTYMPAPTLSTMPAPGSTLTPIPTPSTAPERTSILTGWRWVIVPGVAIVIIFSVVFFIFRRRKR